MTGAMLLAAPVSAFDLVTRVSGAEALEKSVRNVASVATLQAEGATSADEIIAATQTDYRNILAALYRQGYYGPQISIKIDGREASRLSLVSLPARVSRVVITVDPGPLFTFGQTSVSPLAPDTVLPAEFSQGAQARAPLVGQASDAAIDAWRARSHAKAKLNDQRITADHRTQTLDVALGIDPGPSVTLGRLIAAGDTVVSAERIAAISGYSQGAVFSPDALTRAAARLKRTGAFKSVSLQEADALSMGDTIDITAQLVDHTPRRYGFGGEISSLEGGRISGYWLHRNLTKNADRLRVDGEISGLGSATGVDYSLGVSYRFPAAFHHKYTALADAQIAKIDDPNYSAKTGYFAIGAEVETGAQSSVSVRAGLKYSDVTDAFGTRVFHHAFIRADGERDARDDRLNPTRGTYLNASVQPFWGLNGSISGLRTTVDVRGYLPLGDDAKFVLAGRLQMGSILGATYQNVPSDMLFYSGGGGSVRGQPYQSLGVPFGNQTVGGSSYLAFSTELRARMTDNIGVVGFVDLGGVGTDALPSGTTNWHAGAGLGLRYDTGVGPLRLDVAAPIHGATGDGVQIYIGIGQAF